MLQWLKKKFNKSTDTAQDDHSRWKMIESILGFPIHDKTHFKRALRHRSIINGDQYDKHETYERLEFLGDAVLDLIVTEIIFEQFPTKSEGFLTKLRAKLVRGDTLAELAREMELNKVLEIGERARGQGIELSKSVLADVFESTVAAIYLTFDYQKAYDFVKNVILDHLDLEEVTTTVDNFKSLLLEFSQAYKLSLPSYRVVSEYGPGHDKTFEVVVSINETDYGEGTGKSKKQAEQLAAKEAYKKLKSKYESKQ